MCSGKASLNGKQLLQKMQQLPLTATTKGFLVVRQEGARQVRRRIKHYSLDAIISVGYRIGSIRAKQYAKNAYCSF